MRALNKMLVIAALCTMGGLTLSACSSSGNHGNNDFAPSNGDGGNGDGSAGDGGGGGLEFEAFTLGLIQKDTSDTSLPTSINDKTFTDAMDPTIFASLF